MVKDLPANAEDSVFIPGPERSSGEVNGNLLKYSCRKIPWTEKPSKPQSIESQESDNNKKL